MKEKEREKLRQDCVLQGIKSVARGGGRAGLSVTSPGGVVQVPDHGCGVQCRTQTRSMLLLPGRLWQEEEMHALPAPIGVLRGPDGSAGPALLDTVFFLCLGVHSSWSV